MAKSGKALAALAAKAVNTVAQQKAAVSISDKAREFAAQLVMNAALISELVSDYFSLVREAFLAGCKFEELEGAEPSLKQVQAYRSAKSAIVNAKKEGISLMNADGTPAGRTALEKAVKVKRDAASGEGDNVTTSNKNANGKYAYSDKHGVIVAAFAFLKAEPTLRKAYRMEIPEMARMLANDEASKPDVRKPRSVKRAVGAQSAPVGKPDPMSSKEQRELARLVRDSAARQADAMALAAPRTGTNG